MRAYLELIDREVNSLKYYSITVSLNLLSLWQVDQEYGRISVSSNTINKMFTTRLEAMRFAYALVFEKTAKGYHRVFSEDDTVNVINFIPKDAYRLLDRPIWHFLKSHKKFRHLCFKMNALGIQYMGDLVQLSEADISCICSSVASRKEDGREEFKSQSFFEALEAALSHHKLCLNACPVGWKRPTHNSEAITTIARELKLPRDKTWSIGSRQHQY